eukprot:Anaeramoba_flamelloidesc39621_g1_i1.p2 GENE.c39621_g1_i1~~c39621_g1_i1.p2  ORF type:complete len:176 (-),score=20.46 c39621_g1_i1:247-750(-)
MSDEEKPTRKKHQKHRTGGKVKKKQLKDLKKAGIAEGHINPKAFSVRSIQKLRRRLQYRSEREEKKLRRPLRDRHPENIPRIVAVVGPPKSGKSTLIRSLVKQYSKRNITKISGPITLSISKKKSVIGPDILVIFLLEYCFTRDLIRVDFPDFGGPTTATIRGIFSG